MSLHRIIRRTVLISSAASLLIASSAEARTVSFHSVAEGAINCTLSVNHSMLESIATENAESATMTARVNPHAAPGTYSVTLSCYPYTPHTQRIRVAGGKGSSHRGSLLTKLHFARHMPSPSRVKAALEAAAPAAPSPLSVFECITAICPIVPLVQTPTLSASAVKAASVIWPAWEARFTQEAFHDGQCTELADSKRPDIIARVMETVIAENIMAGANPETNQPNWDAQFWDTDAADAGLAVGAAPQAGAIMVFHDGEYNHVTKPGHVAYVDSVAPNGDIEITEEHAPELWQVTTTTLTPSEIAGDDIDYIY